MDNALKVLLFVLVVLYVLSPVDLCPGPIDDLLLAVCAMAGQRG